MISKITSYTLQLYILSCKLEGKEGVDRVEGKNFRGTVEQDAHGCVEATLCFEQYLTAGATGCDGGGEKFSGCVGGGNGENEYGTFGVAGVGVENGATLCAGATGVGGIFLITPANDFAVV